MSTVSARIEHRSCLTVPRLRPSCRVCKLFPFVFCVLVSLAWPSRSSHLPSVEGLNVLSRGRRVSVLLGSHSSAMRPSAQSPHSPKGNAASKGRMGQATKFHPHDCFFVFGPGLGLAGPGRFRLAGPCPATYSRTLMSPRQVPVRCGYFACP